MGLAEPLQAVVVEKAVCLQDFGEPQQFVGLEGVELRVELGSEAGFEESVEVEVAGGWAEWGVAGVKPPRGIAFVNVEPVYVQYMDSVLVVDTVVVVMGARSSLVARVAEEAAVRTAEVIRMAKHETGCSTEKDWSQQAWEHMASCMKKMWLVQS